MRQPIIAGNWKMHLGRVDEALAFVRRIRHPLNEIEGIERVLCPPFSVLAAVAEVLLPTNISLGAQTMHWEERGAHTGEISPAMLEGLCKYVILGHSERRATESMAESDTAINRKVHSAMSHGLNPIICVGENLQQNEAGETHAFVGKQVRAALEGLTAEQAKKCVIAYEPIWAIGTGKAATPADVNRTIGLTVRGAIVELLGEEVAQAVRVQYGGSVNVENIATFMAMPEVDGALVGGASLKPDFVELVRRAKNF
ncbi:MAG: triose-phosphate isomerase [Anaerolineales bacterium]|nr:MAG: triose-phosphate isomerase [Anaerolineales bacterium]